jgi:hypothetical protein
MEPIVELLLDPHGVKLFQNIKIDWKTGAILRMPSEVQIAFEQVGVLKGGQLENRGIQLLGRIIVDLEAVATQNEPIGGKYQIRALIASGRNSVTFLGVHTILSRSFVLKFVRPGAAPDLIAALGRLGEVPENTYIVQPVDVFSIDHHTLSGQPVAIDCVVYPYVEGRTLEEFLSESPPLSPYFLEAFIKQISIGLHALERAGVYHGDLHSRNILVTLTGRGSIEFKIIDVSFGLDSASGYGFGKSDFRFFKEHLGRALTVLQRHLPRMSVRKHLGARLFVLIQQILAAETMRFAEVLELLEHNPEFESFTAARDRFIEARFTNPSPLGLLRHEEITDPAVAVALFEPYPELFAALRAFGNALVYGHRGSGKSTYLASLAWFPDVPQSRIEVEEIFGVFFACRQGEFKQYSSDLLTFDPRTTLRVKHVFVLKVIRRVIATLTNAVQHGRLQEPNAYDRLYSYLGQFITDGTLGAYDADLVSPLNNLHAALMRNEIREIDKLFRLEDRSAVTRLLSETDLRDFLQLIRELFARLAATKFYILFDDAGEPNVPREAQRIMNELIRGTNPIYCVKLSAERFSFLLEDTHGKVLEEGHDYSSYDISRSLFLGSGFDPERAKLKLYFETIVAKRLEYWNYQSFKITDYLGEEFYGTEELVRRLAAGRRNAYYAGWETVWQLADRTTRNLLELVSEIFAAGGIEPRSIPRTIPAREQHSAVKRVSERKWKALSYIPGEVHVRGELVSRGKHLYEFTSMFGRVVRAYLTQSSPSTAIAARYDQRLGIERNDTGPLDTDAEDVLENLIRFGVLDDTKTGVALDDHIRKPIYILNRIFCPTFTISYRRDAHLRLSRKKFETFLLEPARFLRKGTRFLEELDEQPAASEMELFHEP